jgi:hypothetical protein
MRERRIRRPSWAALIPHSVRLSAAPQCRALRGRAGTGGKVTEWSKVVWDWDLRSGYTACVRGGFNLDLWGAFGGIGLTGGDAWVALGWILRA